MKGAKLTSSACPSRRGAGMTVLRSEEFEVGCAAACNGPYDNKCVFASVVGSEQCWAELAAITDTITDGVTAWLGIGWTAWCLRAQ